MIYTSYERVAKNSANFHIFRGQARQRGRGFGALAQTLGRTAIPFIKKFIVSAAKKNGAGLFEIAASEIGENVSGQKKTQNICKRCWNKNSSKSVGRWKKNPSVKQEEPFLEKVI